MDQDDRGTRTGSMDQDGVNGPGRQRDQDGVVPGRSSILHRFTRSLSIIWGQEKRAKTPVLHGVVVKALDSCSRVPRIESCMRIFFFSFFFSHFFPSLSFIDSFFCFSFSFSVIWTTTALFVSFLNPALTHTPHTCHAIFGGSRTLTPIFDSDYKRVLTYMYCNFWRFAYFDMYTMYENTDIYMCFFHKSPISFIILYMYKCIIYENTDTYVCIS